MPDEIKLDQLGRPPVDCPRTFYRIEHWRGGRDSDWRTRGAADRRASELSRESWDDARVVTMHIATGG